MDPKEDPERIPFHRPWITPEDEAGVLEVLRSGWLTMGARTLAFEEDFRRYVGVEQAVAVGSGTAALHLALILAGVGPGDEVITTPLTYAATANEIVHAGGRPVFCDVLPDSLCLDPAATEAAIGPKTKAILPVHYGGLACDMGRFRAMCPEGGPALISDCAHAIETRIGERSPAALSDMAAFSFYANKNITTGEGGMLTLGDEKLAARARRLRLHGFDEDSWEKYSGGSLPMYRLEEAGYKYNMSDIQAVLGLGQLRRIESMWDGRRRIAEVYRAELEGCDGIELPPQQPGVRPAHHLFAIRLGPDYRESDRNDVARKLQAKGIGVSIHYYPLHLQPFYRRTLGTGPGLLPVAEAAAARVISLPIYPLMTEEQARRVADCLKRTLAG